MLLRTLASVGEYEVYIHWRMILSIVALNAQLALR
jgi:hypothetical protein